MNQIYCSNCGQLINIKSNFCKFCGAPQHGKEAHFRTENAPVKEPSPNIAAVVAKPVKASKPKAKDHHISERHLGADAVIYFGLVFWVKTFILFVALMIGAALGPPMFIAGMFVYVIGLVLTAFLVYNNFVYSIDRHGLNIRKGIIFKQRISVPFVQVQNVNVERAIIDRFLGLARVKVETGGFGSTPSQKSVSVTNAQSEAYLPGLRLERAKKIHDVLIDGADGVHGN